MKALQKNFDGNLNGLVNPKERFGESHKVKEKPWINRKIHVEPK